MGFFSRLFGTARATDAVPTVEPVSATRNAPPAEPVETTEEGWYFPAGTDESVFVGDDGQPALHLVEYLDSSGERVLRLVDDRTGLLIGPTDRRLPKLGIWVGQLRGESYNRAGCTSGDFSPGVKVIVAPEPSNEFDPNAVVVHDATGVYRAGYYNKQKAQAMKRSVSAGAALVAISVRGTAAGHPCEQVAVLATEQQIMDRLTQVRPSSLPKPAHLR